LAACLGVEAHIIGPAGFPTSDRAFRRAGMDYLDQASIVRTTAGWHLNPGARKSRSPLVLFTTRATTSYLDRSYRGDDILMFGRESAGVPEEVHAAADAQLTIPMRPGLRSLNVAVTAAMALGGSIAAGAGISKNEEPRLTVAARANRARAALNPGYEV